MSEAAAARRPGGTRAVRVLRKYAAVFGTGIRLRIAFPMDVVMSSVSVVIFVWIFAHLWSATYRATGQTTVAGFTLRDTLWYLMLTEALVLSRSHASANIAMRVRDGSIATFLVRPHGFLHYQAAAGLSDTVFRFALNVAAGSAVVWWVAGPPPHVRGWPLALVAVAAAWTIDFCVSALIGLGAFVVEDVSAFQWIYHKAVLILGGALIPLEFMPGWLRSVSLALPFAYTSYAPARLFVSPDAPGAAAILLGQAAWLAVLIVLLALVYRRCVARLTVNGG